MPRCDRAVTGDGDQVTDKVILMNADGCPLLTSDGDELVIGENYQVIAGKYAGLTGTLEATASSAGNVWLALRGLTKDGLSVSKSVAIADIALFESKLWCDIWDAVANDTFVDMWQKITAMGKKVIKLVFDELPELICQVDPNFALG